MEVIAVAGYDSEVIICDINSGEVVTSLSGYSGAIYGMCFSPSGDLLAMAGHDRKIHIWDCHSWTKIATLIGHTGYITSICFNHEGDELVSISDDETLRTWRFLGSGMPLEGMVIRDLNFINSISLNSSNDIAVSEDKLVNIYDYVTGELKRSMAGHTSFIRAVQFSKDGIYLVSGSNDGTIKLWDVLSGNEIREFKGHQVVICKVCFNGDASRIVSCSEDGTVKIWDVSTGECLLTIRLPLRKWGYCCCFSDDGSKVITGCSDGTAKVWNSYTGEELRTLTAFSYSVFSIAIQPPSPGSYI